MSRQRRFSGVLGCSLAGASMVIKILPCYFHSVRIVGRQMQFVTGVRIVVRLEHFGALHAHLSHELRAVILWWVNSLFEYNLVALQSDCNPLFQHSERLPLQSLDFDAVGVDIVQAEQVVFDRKDTTGAVADHCWVCVVASGQREPHSAYKQGSFSANGAAQKEHNSRSKHTAQRTSQGAKSHNPA